MFARYKDCNNVTRTVEVASGNQHSFCAYYVIEVRLNDYYWQPVTHTGITYGTFGHITGGIDIGTCVSGSSSNMACTGENSIIITA